MGFTGKEALQWKIAYITAFNAIETEIQQKQKEVKQVAALPAVKQIDAEIINRINKRAWQLGQAAYEGYYSDMMDDPLVRTGITKPEEWVATEQDVFELLQATARTLATASINLERRSSYFTKMHER